MRVVPYTVLLTDTIISDIFVLSHLFHLPTLNSSRNEANVPQLMIPNVAVCNLFHNAQLVQYQSMPFKVTVPVTLV
jgi:hypothetical protein